MLCGVGARRANRAIFSHATPAQIDRCLAEAAKVLKPRGVVAATFCECAADFAGRAWVYPGCVEYTFDRIAKLAEEHRLACRRLLQADKRDA